MRMFQVLIISICVLILKGDVFQGRNGMTHGSWVMANAVMRIFHDFS